jgi:hypothetical protein
MLELLVLLIFNSLLIVGIYSITQDGMIFHFARKLFIKSSDDDFDEEYYVPWLFKPLIGCPTCMSSVHSTYFYWFFQEWTLQNLYIYPLYVLALAGLNALLHKYLETI